MDPTVERLFRQGDAAVLDVLPRLQDFMNDAVRVGALRLCFLGLADKTQKAEFSFVALFNEWNRLLGLMGAKSDRATKQRLNEGFALNENDIRRYVFLENRPRDPKRKGALLALLAVHEIENGSSKGNSPKQLVSFALQMFDFVEPIQKFLTTRDPSDFGPKPTAQISDAGTSALPTPATTLSQDTADLSRLKANELEALTNKALRTMLRVDPTDQSDIGRWLFGESDIRHLIDKPDASYYVLYRYSTQIPEIVKTFLVINSPALSGGLGSFTFAHVYLSKRNKVKRITRGTLVSFARSIYLVGMSAQVLRGRDPIGRPNIDRPDGLKLMAVPVSEAQTGYDLLPAVYMSNSLKWQPIVGRLALVHVGFQSTVGPLSDSNKEIAPTILFGPEALADDLRKICGLPNSTPREENAADLAKKILIKINNRPFCDRERTSLSSEGVTRALLPEDEQFPGP